MDSELPLFQFDDKREFWLIRAEGGKYFDDFVNNDYVGIRYNRVTVRDLYSLKRYKPTLSLDDVRELIFSRYNGSTNNKTKVAAQEDLSTISKSQLTVHAKQTYLFTFEMKKGDFVLTPAKQSYEFALGMIVGDPYDESSDLIDELKVESKNGDIAYAPSNYIKRRKIKWLSIIKRKDLPKEMAWIVNMHQAVGKLDAKDPSKLFNLVTPFYKYKDKYYLRVYTSHGGELSAHDWLDLISFVPEDDQENIDLRADVNSPGFFTFLTSNLNGLWHIIEVLGGGAIGSTAMLKIAKAVVGEDNLKNKGIVEWGQDVIKRHSDNKLHNMKNKIQYKKEKEEYKEEKKKYKQKDKATENTAEKLGLSIKDVGKTVEKSKDKIIRLDIKDNKDQKDIKSNTNDSKKHS